MLVIFFIFSSWAEEGERSDTNFSDIGEADSVSIRRKSKMIHLH